MHTLKLIAFDSARGHQTMDYAKIIKALIEHFVLSEGTDYLGWRGEPAPVDGLEEHELVELTRLRDEARKTIGWTGYDD